MWPAIFIDFLYMWIVFNLYHCFTFLHAFCNADQRMKRITHDSKIRIIYHFHHVFFLILSANQVRLLRATPLESLSKELGHWDLYRRPHWEHSAGCAARGVIKPPGRIPQAELGRPSTFRLVTVQDIDLGLKQGLEVDFFCETQDAWIKKDQTSAYHGMFVLPCNFLLQTNKLQGISSMRQGMCQRKDWCSAFFSFTGTVTTWESMLSWLQWL